MYVVLSTFKLIDHFSVLLHFEPWCIKYNWQQKIFTYMEWHKMHAISLVKVVESDETWRRDQSSVTVDPTLREGI
jgi:hypothetical protein